MKSRFCLAALTVAALSACASHTPMMAPYSQAKLPDAVKVPAGHSVLMETTTDIGQITYQCRAQVAVAPNGEGNIPSQLVKASPAIGMGAMQGVSHIQRVATLGGTAPKSVCGKANESEKQVVTYSTDYIVYKAM